jgi:hypothetical protein
MQPAKDKWEDEVELLLRIDNRAWDEEMSYGDPPNVVCKRIKNADIEMLRIRNSRPVHKVLIGYEAVSH